LRGLKLGSSMIYGSGLRSDLELADGSTVPNGASLPGYAQFNLSASYKLERPGVEFRFDLINLFDAKYQIRDGTGVGVGAPQWARAGACSSALARISEDAGARCWFRHPRSEPG
jgi:outer membrane receptor protein involved in Fe transport